MKVAYISGPMTGYKNFNFPAFDSCRDALQRDGVLVYSPADHDRDTIEKCWPGQEPEDFDGYADGDIKRYFDAVTSGGEFTLDAMLAWDFAVIGQECDSIVMLPGWEKSSGARDERYVAERTGKQVWLANNYEAYDFEKDDGVRRTLVWYFTLDTEKRMVAPVVKDQPERTWAGHTAKAADLPAPLKINGPQTWAVKQGEVRVTNEKTGGQKGTKLARFELLPAGPLTELAEHYGRGSQKYEDRNWERGYDWSLSFGALMRHAWAFWSGEDIDAETGSKHIIAVAWHALALAEFMQTHPDLDNRALRD